MKRSSDVAYATQFYAEGRVYHERLFSELSVEKRGGSGFTAVDDPGVMIRDTITQIESKLKDSGSMSPAARQELTELLAKLKAGITELERTDADQARSIAGFAQTSTHEATRSEKNEELLKHSLDGLSASVNGFEESHPQLVQIVNRICTTLSNLGI